MGSLNLINPHWEALTTETKLAFQIRGNLGLAGRFYLAGGSGLALHLGHRFSIDLDFFSAEPDSVRFDERAELRQAFDDSTLSIIYDKDTTFVANWRGVGLSFFVAAVKYAQVRTFPISATRALAYFEDAEVLPMPRMLDRTPWSKMKRFLEQQAMNAGRQKLEGL